MAWRAAISGVTGESNAPMRSPFAHQELALAWGHGRDRVLFALDTRLGKSLVGWRWARQFRTPDPTLIVAPNLLVADVWATELTEEGAERPAVFLGATHAGTTPGWERFPVVVTTYRTLRQGWSTLATVPWRTFLLDESACIRSPQAQQTKGILTLARVTNPPHRALLSANPTPNHEDAEWICQMLFLHDTLYGCADYWTFRARRMHEAGFDWVLNDRADFYRTVVTPCRFRMSRADAGVFDDKRYAERPTQLPRGLRRVYDDAEKHFLVEGEVSKHSVANFAYCLRVAGGLVGRPKENRFKLSAMCEHLDTVVDDGEQFLVWAAFTTEIVAVARTLRLHYGTSGFLTLRGKIPHEERLNRLKAFQSGAVRGLVIHPELGRYGLDLSMAAFAWYFSCTTKPDDRQQSEDRLMHVTRTEPAYVYDQPTERTADAVMRRVLRTKAKKTRGTLRRIRLALEGQTNHGP